jgi:hypothetical protein
VRARAIAVSAAAGAIMALSAGCGGGHRTPAPARAPAIGITEANPALVWSARERPAEPAPFARARAKLAALRPAYYRLMISWAGVQPRADAPPDWGRPDPGCERATPPCAPFAGVREQLRAVRSAQRAQRGGWQVVVNFLYTPPWAARGPGGCEPGRVDPTSRQIAPAALPAYRAMVRSLAQLGRAEGVELRYWSAWNEPNYRGFASPQRASCAAGSASVAPAYYGELVRQLRTALAGVPGRHDVLLGEVSDPPASGPKATSAVDFARGLPGDVVCSSDLWAQHVYVGDPDTVPGVEAALDARGCGRRHRVWITEAGVGGPRPGGRRPTDPVSLRAQCREMDGLLGRWHRDPRVQAAFQYSFREDDLFPVGLVDPALVRLYQPYDAWAAWGRRHRPDDPPPALPQACRA